MRRRTNETHEAQGNKHDLRLIRRIRSCGFRTLGKLITDATVLVILCVFVMAETSPTLQQETGGARSTNSENWSTTTNRSEALSSWGEAGLRFGVNDQAVIEARAHILDCHRAPKRYLDSSACGT